jgi:hypothetical protein
MSHFYKPKQVIVKERDTGPKGGERQPAHEGGREGSGTKPSGTGGKSGSVTIGGSKSGTVYPGPAPSPSKKP